MSQLRAETARLLGVFEATGAVRVEADILQPADVLLDLYGEDIRARAYVTSDPLRGEQMLRPDFTVPVVQRHMAVSADLLDIHMPGRCFAIKTARLAARRKASRWVMKCLTEARLRRLRPKSSDCFTAFLRPWI